MSVNNLASNFKRWFSLHWVQVFLTLLLLLIVRFFPLLFDKSPIYGDNFSLMVPGKLFTSFWVQKGIFPLWNPTIFGGIPWLGDINQSIFYPSTFLFILFSPGWALNINLLIHLSLTFIGTYVVARKLHIKHLGALVTGIIWTLSPQLTGAINNLSIIQSLAWVPWVVWAGINLNKKPKTWLVFSLLVMIQFLAGYPQHLIFTIVLSVIFSLLSKKSISWWQWLKSWLITGLIAISMTSFLWLPFLQNLMSSTRMIQSSNQLITGSLHPVELIKLVFPYLFEKPTVGYRWGISWNSFPNLGVYVSWLGLLLPFLIWQSKRLQPRDKFYIAIITGSFLLSLGGYLPGFIFLQKLLPFGAAMRGPSIVLLITTFVFALWIGDLITRIKKKNYKWLNIGFIVGGVSAFLFFTLVYFKFDWVYQIISPYLAQASFFNFAKLKVLLTAFATHLWFHFLFLGLAWWGLKRFQPLLIVVLVFELVFFTQGQLFFAPSSLYHSDHQPIFSQINNPQFRVLTRNFNQAYTDYGAYWDALSIRRPFSDSFVDQAEMQDWQHLLRMKKGLTPDWNMPVQTRMIHGYTTLLPQNVDELFNQSSAVAINALPPISLDDEILKKWAVKYYLVDTWFPYPTGVEDLQPIAQQEYWQLYELPSLPRFRFIDGASVNLMEFKETPNSIEFSFKNKDNKQWLVMADRYDENWQAEINGGKVVLENYQGMRRIEIKPGRNEVRFNYVPRWFYWGLFISGLTLALLSFVCLTRARFTDKIFSYGNKTRLLRNFRNR